MPANSPSTDAAPIDLHVPHVETVLENGLRVVLHEDHSDPVVAVYVSYHVGSAREERGRSGFAHLFEHMLFQGSENVADDQHFKFVSEAGGTLNGTTNLDRTLYYETLPSNQLEVALWLEADRMGFLLPAMSQEKLDNQRDVVRNERRQNYENRPYGQARGAIVAALYPPDHPYSWLTIGSHEDLEAATLEDVHGFFRRWYGPNNATLAIGGDIDREATLELVRRYFGPIPRGPEVRAPAPQAASLRMSVRLVQEDDVQLPQLELVWPGTTRYSEDDAALNLLSMVLSQNKSALLDRALTVERVLAQRVVAHNASAEMAGTFNLSLRAAPGVRLDQLEQEVDGILRRLDEAGVDPAQLQRMQNRLEFEFVRALETVSAKTRGLAEYDTFLRDPDHFSAELEAHTKVRAGDVHAALRRYLLDRPRVALSVVPRGAPDQAASGRSPRQVALEASFDRSRKPGPQPTPSFESPRLWHATFAGDLRVSGTPLTELPMTSLALSLPGGRLAETRATLGISSLTAQLMNEGTRELSTTQFADALDSIGTELSVRAGEDELSVSLSVLDKHLDGALGLLADALLEPRFDPADFERLKARRLTTIATRGDNIRGITTSVWKRLMYGDEGVLGQPSLGTRQTIEALELDDVRAFHGCALELDRARLVLASGMDEAALRARTEGMLARWQARGTALSAAPAAPPAVGDQAAAGESTEGARIFLVDKPGAAQSEVRIGHMSVARSDEDHWPLTVVNYVLGGVFSSRINMNLREDKGYTYGARSSFSGGLRPGPFVASAAVKTDVTAQAVVEFMKELRGIVEGITEEELAFARSALTQAQLRQYESSRARLGLVDVISLYRFPDDWVESRLRLLQSFSTEDLNARVREHVHPDAMTILVVGDRESVLPGLQDLGMGEVRLLDVDGLPSAP